MEQKPSFGVECCCPQRVLDKVGVQGLGTRFLVGQVSGDTAGVYM